jgi:hypothetical protein
MRVHLVDGLDEGYFPLAILARAFVSIGALMSMPVISVLLS